jgi:hypothetical protein
MISLLRVFILIFVFSPAIAWAQSDDLYKPKAKDGLYSGNSLPAPDPVDAGKNLQDIFEPTKEAPAPQQEATSVDLANEYFLRCKNEEQDYLRPKTKEYLCGCSSAKMAQHLTFDEIQALDRESKKGDAARAKFIINAYAPCIYKPTRDVSKRRCLASQQVRRIWSGRYKVCNCTANLMEDYMRAAGHVVITKALDEAPMSLDPLERYIDSEGFYAQMRNYMKGCIYEYSYGN